MSKKAKPAQALNQNEKREIIRRLESVPEAELTNEEAELLLEEELKKTTADMNTAMIAELLEVLEPESLDDEAVHSSWNQLEKLLPVKPKKRTKVNGVHWIGKIAACILVICVLVYATSETAEAYHWQFLQRWFTPEAETFTLYSSNQPEMPAVQVQDDGVYGDSDARGLSEQFAALADFPDTYAGHRVKPTWMPERFAYLNGSLYADTNMAKTSIIYQSSSREMCIVSMALVSAQQTVSGFDDRQMNDDSALRRIGSAQVLFSQNDAQGMLSATWIVEQATFSVSGNLSEEEIIRIIEGLTCEQPG